MDGSADSLGADGLADRALCAGLGAAVGLCGVRGCGLGYGGCRRLQAAGAVSAASEAEAAIAAAAMASGAVALSVACVAAGAAGAAAGTATAMASAVTTAVPILRRSGLIGYRGSVAGRRLASSRRTSRHRTSVRRTSICARRVVAALVSVSVLVSASALASTLRPRLSRVPCRSRALAAALRSFESLRAALSALSDAAALLRDRLSDAACASSERRGAGGVVLVRDCRCGWRPYCCRPASRSCRFAWMARIRPGGSRRRVLKRCVCRYF